MKAKGKKQHGPKVVGNGGVKAPYKHPLAEKAEKLRANWTEAAHAAVVKKFPEHAALELLRPLKVLSETKIEELQTRLNDDMKRLTEDRNVYESLRNDGIKKLSDYAITEVSPAKALTERLEQARNCVVRGEYEVESKKARLAELQGGLIAPTTKALPAPPKVVEKPTVERQKDVTWLPMYRDVLEACVMVAPKDDVRYYLNGVFLQAEKQSVRAVATNGHSLLLHSTPVLEDEKEKLAPWLEDGVILPREGLALALTTLGKLKTAMDEPVSSVLIGYAKGHAHVTIKDEDEQVVFKMRVIDGKFPVYRKVLEDAAVVLEGGERAPMSTITMDGNYVKLAVGVGTKLGSKGLTPFIGAESTSPTVITFMGVPNAMYLIMPIRATAADQMPTQTMALLGNGLKGTLAALKATQTRQKKQMGEEKNEAVKKNMAAVIAERDQRIAAVLEAMNGKALPAPKAKAAEPVETESESEDVEAANEGEPVVAAIAAQAEGGNGAVTVN